MTPDEHIDFSAAPDQDQAADSEPQFATELPELDLEQLLPPHSLEAEQAVIGGLLLANHRWDDVAELIGADDFYRDEHRQIFRALEILVEEQQPRDVVTLQSKLLNLGALERIGGLKYLAELAENTPSAANIQAYAQLVQEKSIARKLLITADQLQTTTRNPEGRNAQQIIEEAERELQKIAEGRSKDGGPKAMNEILKGTVEQIENL
ncbi:MAG: replicative DNA helicase, partial [Pseudomonadales bacterium]|nr:replicative DNA helicase [Pseudomonadales bacterium]